MEGDIWNVGNPVTMRMWKPLERLKERALSRRRMALTEGARIDANSELTATSLENVEKVITEEIMEDSPLDWVRAQLGILHRLFGFSNFLEMLWLTGSRCRTRGTRCSNTFGWVSDWVHSLKPFGKYGVFLAGPCQRLLLCIL